MERIQWFEIIPFMKKKNFLVNKLTSQQWFQRDLSKGKTLTSNIGTFSAGHFTYCLIVCNNYIQIEMLKNVTRLTTPVYVGESC